MPTIDVGFRRVEYIVVRRTSRRYTYFRFRQDLTLEISLPRGRPLDVQKAIDGNIVWLRREYDRLAGAKHILGRDEVMFEGRVLKVVFSGGNGDFLAPEPLKGIVTLHTDDPERVTELVRRWFLTESSAYVVGKVAELAPKMGVRPSRVDVREISKWGYCTRRGRLSFSWQLIALPERLREYVVLHELTHLSHFDHSPAFKRKLATFCPDFRACEKELDLIVPYDRPAL